MERQTTNVVLTKEESNRLKGFCADFQIPFFRTEYYDKIYCQLKVTADERKLVDDFLMTL